MLVFCVPSSSRDWLGSDCCEVGGSGAKGILLRRDFGQSRDRGLLTRGRDAGKDVKRKRVVVGDVVPTLSDDSTVVSTALLAAVVLVAVVL